MNADRKNTRSEGSKLSRGFWVGFTLLLAISLLVFLNAPYHSFLRKFNPSEIKHDDVIGSALVETEESQENISVENINDNPNSNANYLTADSFTTKVLTSDDIHSGDLVLVNEEYPYIGDTSDFTDYNQEEINGYWVSTYKLSFQKKIASGIKELAKAYNDNFNNDKRFFVYNTSDTDTSAYPLYAENIPERASGYCVDIALKAEGSGAVAISDEVALWLSENCYKYGFIVGEQPYHLRYVGKANASVMTQLKMNLEEYLDFLKDYTYESPYCFEANQHSYEIFYIPSQGDSTDAVVPKSNDYYISGNNVDGFIEIILVDNPNQ